MLIIRIITLSKSKSILHPVELTTLVQIVMLIIKHQNPKLMAHRVHVPYILFQTKTIFYVMFQLSVHGFTCDICSFGYELLAECFYTSLC